MMALAIIGTVVMVYTGYMYVIHPLDYLRQGLRKLESGDFSARVNVDTQDEFGQVAAGFNHMALTLQSMYEGLEAKVVDKTKRIEAQRARLEALYEVSAFLARASTIEELANGFSQRVRVVMKADAVVVRWSDEVNQRYLMLASNCFPAEMQEDERSLLAGACACGSLRPDARTRVIPIHHHGAEPIRHCARAGYRNLVSVPVRLQQRMLGEVDLFFRSDVHLSADESELLDALASHLASALEGLRAAALEREAAVGEERALLARELHDSIAQSLVFLMIQVQLLRTALERSQPDTVQRTMDELDEGLRESINDVREHADATHVSLDVQKGARWQFTVRDNGIGFDTSVQHGETHVGSKIMRERAERIGAQVRVESRKGDGTAVTLTLPPYPVAAVNVATVGLDLPQFAPQTP